MTAALMAVLAAVWKPLAAIAAGAFVFLMAVLKGKANAERDQARADAHKSKEMRDANASVDRRRDAVADRLRDGRF